MLPQPRLLSALDDQPPAPPPPPECPLKPLNAFECELSALCCAHELDDGLLTLTVFPLTLRLSVFPLFRL